MRKESNLKIYIKEKNTKIAFIFFILFLILLVLSYIPNVYYLSGVRNDFSMEKIEFVSSNNNDTTYIVSKKNNLFYSQDKSFDASHLNQYCKIKNVSNAYGDATTNRYNFIRINYTFPCKIIDVKGYADDINGQNGYTLILLENGELYYLSNDINQIKVLLNNVTEFYCVNKNILIKTKDNKLLYYYLYNKELLEIDTEIENVKKAFIASDNVIEDKIVSKIYFLNNDNSLNSISLETKNIENKIKINDQNVYPIYNLSIDKKEINFKILENVKDITTIDYSSLILTFDNKLYGIDEKNHLFSKENEINQIENTIKIDSIYSTGRYAFILKEKSNIYFIGDIKIDKTENYLKIKKITNNYDNFYGSNNGIFLIKKGKIFIYDKNSATFKEMYINYLIYYVQRYFSLFVCVMIILYFILSYVELSKRYNRYYKDGGKLNG